MNANVFFLSVATFLFAATATRAQQNAIKITPFQPAIGKFSAQYEHAVNEHVTLAVEYQQWFETRRSNVGLWFIGVPASATSVVRTDGHRMYGFARYYSRQALRGFFAEGGVYAGKYSIKTTDEAFLFGFSLGEPEEKQYRDVSAFGARVGVGTVLRQKNLLVEFSGGLSLNSHEHDIATSLGLRPTSPYSRIAIGVAF